MMRMLRIDKMEYSSDDIETPDEYSYLVFSCYISEHFITGFSD